MCYFLRNFPGNEIQIIFYFCYGFHFRFTNQELPMKESKLTGHTFSENYWGRKPEHQRDKKICLTSKRLLNTFPQLLSATKALAILFEEGILLLGVPN